MTLILSKIGVAGLNVSAKLICKLVDDVLHSSCNKKNWLGLHQINN